MIFLDISKNNPVKESQAFQVLTKYKNIPSYSYWHNVLLHSDNFEININLDSPGHL